MSGRHSLYALTLVGVLLSLAVVTGPALALDPRDPPVISCVSAGENQVTIKICGGGTGADAGLTLHWKKYEDWLLNGWDDAGDLCRTSLSGQPSYQHPGHSRWELLAGECVDEFQVGDINFDETGVSGEGCALEPLECGTEYVFRAFAHAGRRMGRSDWTADLRCSTIPCPPDDCTHTQGFWKTHGPLDGACHSGNNTNAWPVSSLTLGNATVPPGCSRNPYNATDLCRILNEPAQGRKILILGHQLISAKLNVASGATCPEILTIIAQADALILNRCMPPMGTGQIDNPLANTLAGKLDQFNNGIFPGCPPHCQDPASLLMNAPANAERAPWGTIKVRYR